MVSLIVECTHNGMAFGSVQVQSTAFVEGMGSSDAEFSMPIECPCVETVFRATLKYKNYYY